MKAVDFVKKHGWEEAKKASVSIFNGDVTYKREDINIDDLKRLVESWELVEKHGGLFGTKKGAEKLEWSNQSEWYNKLIKAIEDVESVGGGV